MSQRQIHSHLLVATDIFGATPALQQALAELQRAAGGLELTICQPLSCEAAADVFHNDQLAYQAFLQHGGLEYYQQQVQHTMQSQRPDLVLGFSAGAAALWCTLGRGTVPDKPGRALFCYGGQIRQYSTLADRLAANWPVTCLWSDETHFDVVALQQQLSRTGNVRQQHWPQRHGFINPHSTGFDAGAASVFWQRCQRWVLSEDF